MNQQDMFYESILKSSGVLMEIQLGATSKIWDKLKFYERMREIWGSYDAHVRVKSYQGIWLW